MSKVLLLHAQYENIQEPVEAIFRHFPLDLAGKTIFIKPNLVIGKPPHHAATTHPLLVKAIVEACLARGALKVMVGDNPGGPEHLVRPVAEAAGFLPLLEPYFIDMSKDIRDVRIDSALATSVPVSSAIMDADLLINVPKFKTQPLAVFTGCIKNMFGAIPGLEKARMHTLYTAPHQLVEFLIKLYSAVTPHLNIVDAITAMEGEGPSHGTPRHVGKLIAGYNGAEVDVVLGAMLGLPTEKMRFYKTMEQEGLGKPSLKDITLMGSFEPLKGFSLPTLNTLSADDVKLLFKHHGPLKPQLTEELCTLCGRCIEVCLSKAIEMKDYPRIDYNKCIACWCCFEMCPEGAYFLPDAASIVQKIKAGQPVH